MAAVQESVLGNLPVPLAFAHAAESGNTEHAQRPQHLRHILDIRREKPDVSLKDQIAALLNPADSASVRWLPSTLLWDARGLRLFEEITYLDEYYPTDYEIDLLTRSSTEIASKIPAGSMLIELGSGNLRKVCILLQCFEDQAKPVDYYALDLSQEELERTLADVPAFKYVSCHGLLGTYDDGKEWLKQQDASMTKCILHLGSSIGYCRHSQLLQADADDVLANLHRDEAAEFLRDFANLLRSEDDFIVVGLDSCMDPGKIYRAYNDSKGVGHRYILNGLAHANRTYGEQIFDVNEWRVVGEYVHDSQGGRHQTFVSPVREVTVLGSVIKPPERIQFEQSLKYSKTDADSLWKSAELVEDAVWSRDGEYGIYLLKRV